MKNIIQEFYAVEKDADTAVWSKCERLDINNVSLVIWSPDKPDVLDDLVMDIRHLLVHES